MIPWEKQPAVPSPQAFLFPLNQPIHSHCLHLHRPRLDNVNRVLAHYLRHLLPPIPHLPREQLLHLRLWLKYSCLDRNGLPEEIIVQGGRRSSRPGVGAR